jgi:hypothetical protein
MAGTTLTPGACSTMVVLPPMQNGIFFTLRGRAAWAHDYNNDRAVTAVFQTLPGAAFVVNGARASPDAALLSVGAAMKWLNRFSRAATFEGEFSGRTPASASQSIPGDRGTFSSPTDIWFRNVAG